MRREGKEGHNKRRRRKSGTPLKFPNFNCIPNSKVFRAGKKTDSTGNSTRDLRSANPVWYVLSYIEDIEVDQILLERTREREKFNELKRRRFNYTYLPISLYLRLKVAYIFTSSAWPWK